MSDHDEKHLLSGAYALNSLTPEEAAEFEAYAEGSEEARAETASLSDTAVRLGLATEPVQPSPELKNKLMAAIRSTPQLQPDAVSQLSQGASAPPPQASPVEQPQRLEDAAPLTDAAPLEARAEQKARARWFTRPVTILTAAAAAVLLFVGGTFVGQLTERPAGNPALQAQAASLVELSAANDVQRAQGTVAGGGQATLIWSLQLRRSAVVLDELPALPADKTYQLWYIDTAGAKPAGTFEPSASGTTWHVLDGTMSGGDTVGVTVEPAGGSAQPTTKPIVAIPTA
ncbi:anti-sigma factor [Parafrigoribacterium soli]|uniref:anti-sigma factor n=1 Tax=Parafrigoribacterium soli TaxID=3144663 RepID=UPI0032F07CB1